MGLRAPSHRPEKGVTVTPLKTTAAIGKEVGLRAKSGTNLKNSPNEGTGDTVSPFKTTNDIAQEVGLTGRSVQHRKQIANKITPGVQEVIAETAIADSTTQLLDLACLGTWNADT